MKNPIVRYPVLSYYILTFAISWGGGIILFGLDPFLGARELLEAQFLLIILIGIAGPSVASILLTGLIAGREGFRELGSRLFTWRVGARWYAVALLTGPLLRIGILFALSLISPEYIPGILISDQWASLVLIGLATGLAAGFFEELGWTGFAIPRLRRRHGILTTGLIVGFLWGVWHVPLFIREASASKTVPLALSLFAFFFSYLPAFRVLLVWVYDRTKSLLVVMLMHAGLSAIQAILPSQGAGMEAVTSNLIFAAVLWILIATVAATNHGRLYRSTSDPLNIRKDSLT